VSIDAVRGVLHLEHPRLPEYLPQLRIENLRVGEATVALELTRHEQDVLLRVLQREGDVEIVIAE
jgi:hypothetical protein